MKFTDSPEPVLKAITQIKDIFELKDKIAELEKELITINFPTGGISHSLLVKMLLGALVVAVILVIYLFKRIDIRHKSRHVEMIEQISKRHR